MNVQNISSLPSYLSNFINSNHEQLNDIYIESNEEYGPGILSFKVSGSENRVDVKYMPEQELLHSLSAEMWEGLKSQSIHNGDKKIYLIEDMEKSSMFIVYI
jgi:hypothetical protein|tara:strand:- start:28 stop:333 length:306 start_codon:yes stop_codon:yes gene_type:complete